MPIQLDAEQVINQTIGRYHKDEYACDSKNGSIDIDGFDFCKRREFFNKRQGHHQLEKNQHKPIAILMFFHPEPQPIEGVP
jgi:hypothetical protein